MISLFALTLIKRKRTEIPSFFHINGNITQNTVMGAPIALTILQFLITMLFFPLKFGAKGHASLARDRVELNLSLFGIAIVRLRIKRENGEFCMYINGEKKKPKKNVDFGKAVGVVRQFKVQNVRLSGNLLALIGADDAKNSAMLCAAITCVLQPLFDSLRVYTARPSDALELDGKVTVHMNVLQLGSIIAAGLGW